jgi:hypothetical protein
MSTNECSTVFFSGHYFVVFKVVAVCLLVAAPNFCSVATASPRRLLTARTFS